MSDISRLRIDMPEQSMPVAIKAMVSRAKGRDIQRRFLRGPVPLDWLQQSALLPGRAVHLGIALWFLDGFRQTGTIKAEPKLLREFGMDRHASYRALNRLEKAGLISVERKKGAAPMVTLLVRQNCLESAVADSLPEKFGALQDALGIKSNRVKNRRSKQQENEAAGEFAPQAHLVEQT